MLIEINQRGDRDYAVYVDKAYAGTVSSKDELDWVCTHTAQRFATVPDAVDFLITRERRNNERTTTFDPEPEQIAAFARWLMQDDVKRALAVYMPKVGGPPAARENRVADVAAALQIHAAVLAETNKPRGS